MYTEEEAKTKNCCGPWLEQSHTGKCAASDCMAWRWSQEKDTSAFLARVRQHMATQGIKNFAKAMQEVYEAHRGEFVNTEGFCGLGGKP